LSKSQNESGTEAEEWRDVPGYGGNYQASSLGRIRSKPRIVRKPHRGGKIMKQRYAMKVLKPSVTHGYEAVKIGFDGRKITARVHHLVLMAFKGPRPDGAMGLHWDGNSLNNRPRNLRWGSHGDNMADRKRHGNYAGGEDHHMAKLTNAQVEEIRARGLTCKQVVNEFGVSRSQAYRIIKGQSR